MDEIKKLMEQVERCWAPRTHEELSGSIEDFNKRCIGCHHSGEFGCHGNLILELIAKIKERL